MDETAHLLSTPANVKRLMESVAQDKAVIGELNLGNYGEFAIIESQAKIKESVTVQKLQNTPQE